MSDRFHVEFAVSQGLEGDRFLVYDGEDVIAEGLTATAALLRALGDVQERLAEAEAWEVEVKRQWCILLERNQVMSAALEALSPLNETGA